MFINDIDECIRWDGENILEFVFNTFNFIFLAFSSKFSKFFMKMTEQRMVLSWALKINLLLKSTQFLNNQTKSNLEIKEPAKKKFYKIFQRT